MVIEIGVAVGFVALGTPVAVVGFVGPRPVAKRVMVWPGWIGVPGGGGGPCGIACAFPVPLGPSVKSAGQYLVSVTLNGADVMPLNATVSVVEPGDASN